MSLYKNILLIMRRSLGDVLAVSPLIDILRCQYPDVTIDLLVNEDTQGTARLLNGVGKIIPFSYADKGKSLIGRLTEQVRFIRRIYRRYDLAIALTTNERSNIHAFLASRRSVGAYEAGLSKNWWHKLLVGKGYQFRPDKHIALNNLEPLRLLDIPVDRVEISVRYSDEALKRVRHLLAENNIRRFVIFHSTARFLCKAYPKERRNRLLSLLDSLGLPIVVTGGKSRLDQQIAKELPEMDNVYPVVGEITLEECAALTDLALAYIGVDTFNAHLAAAFNKRVFVMLGPANPELWSPWSNTLQSAGHRSPPVQRYGNITLFQSQRECVPCGHSKCEGQDHESPCMTDIDPGLVFEKVRNWLAENGA